MTSFYGFSKSVDTVHCRRQHSFLLRVVKICVAVHARPLLVLDQKAYKEFLVFQKSAEEHKTKYKNKTCTITQKNTYKRII